MDMSCLAYTAKSPHPLPSFVSHSPGGIVCVSYTKSDHHHPDALHDGLFTQRGVTQGKRRYLNYADADSISRLNLQHRQASMSSDTSPRTRGPVSETSLPDSFPIPSTSTGLAEGSPSISTDLSTSLSFTGSSPISQGPSETTTSSEPPVPSSIIGGGVGLPDSSSLLSPGPTPSPNSPTSLPSSTPPGQPLSSSSQSRTVSLTSRQVSPISTGGPIQSLSNTFMTTITIPEVPDPINTSITFPLGFTTMTTTFPDTTLTTFSLSMTTVVITLPTFITLPPLSESSTTSDTASTSPSLNSTSIPSTSPPLSSSTSITSSFSTSTDVIASLNTSFSVFPTASTVPDEISSTIPFPFPSRFPAYTSDYDAPPFASSESSPLISTTTAYWTRTLTDGYPTITYSTIIQTGVLSSDNPDPNENVFAHNTGAIIGVTLAGVFTVIVSVVIIFFMCRRYYQRRNGHGGREGSDVNSVNGGEGSRENFLRQELEAMNGGGEGPTSSWVHGVGTAGPRDAMMIENHGSGPVSFPLYSYYDSGGKGGAGAASGGFGSGTSAESAGMYPPQTHALPTSYPAMDPYLYAPAYATSASVGIAVPMGPSKGGISSPDDIMRVLPQPPPPLHLPDSVLWPSLPPSNMGSPTQAFASYSYPLQQPQNYSHPYQYAPQAATSGGIGSVGTGQSDPFADAHAATAISSLSGHGHPDPDSEAIASSACLGGSSSQGHLVSSGGHGSGSGNGTGGAGSGSGGGVMTSSSGHGAGMSIGGIMTSSSGHGHGGFGSAGSRSRSKSNSPTTEMKKLKLPPSSYVPPRSETTGSSGSSGSEKSSGRGLLGRLKSISRSSKSKERERERDRRRSLQTYDSGQPGAVGGRRMSSGEGNTLARRSMSVSTSMSMGHAAALGHTTLLHHHGPPSSLLNPPNAIPIPPPGSSMAMQRNDVVPPTPSIQYPELSMGGYHPHAYVVGPDYDLPNEFGVEEMWVPPTISGDLLRPPSPASTETSSYVEGLLNPRMLPGGGGNSGSGTPGTTKYPAFRGGAQTTGGGMTKREWSTGSGTAISARGFSPMPGQGRGSGLGMCDGEGSVMSLRDNVDYSRPISGNAIVERMRSTTTFGTDVGGDGRTVTTSPSPVPTSAGAGGGGGFRDASMRGAGTGTPSESKRGSGSDAVETENEGEGRIR